MGWIQELKLKKEITDNDVDKILENIKQFDSESWTWSKQYWGWSAGCDISLDDDCIIFSGALYSFGTNFPELFLKEAKKLKLPVSSRLGKRDG